MSLGTNNNLSEKEKKAKEKEELKILKRKDKHQKKVRKKMKKRRGHILYRVIHQKKKPFILIYLFEVIFATIIEIISFLLSVLGWVFGICCILGLICGVFAYNKFYPMYLEYKDLSDEIVANSSIEDFKISEGSVIYDSDGNILANLYETSDQIYIEYDDIPEDVVDAFVAIEDQSFWSNNGIDLKGITRILYNFVKTDGDEVHGASTITQQLVKNIYLTSEVSIERKAKEMLIAMGLTEKYTKDEIMEFYVNDICYGNGIYGIGGAAKRYFNCEVSELTLSQCAYLCAIPNRPSYYDPLKHPDNAIDRRDKILRDMLDCGYITEDEYKTAIAEEIKIENPDYIFNDYETTYAVDCAVRYIMGMNGFKFEYTFKTMDDYNEYHSSYNKAFEEAKHQLYTGGYKIYTTLDVKACDDLQGILSDTLSFSDEVDENTGIYTLQGALTVIDNETGKVVAIVGGREQEELSDSSIYSYNRAYQAYRQPGSSIKPLIVYTPALESDLGYTPNTIVHNIDVSKAKEKGVDVQKLYGTSMTLRSAVEQSKNGVAWQIFDALTPSVGLEFITNMQYSNICPSDYYNAASLGGLTYGVTTVEQASGYSTLENHGIYRKPTCISSILNSDGEEIYVDAEEYRVYDSDASDEMVDILKGVLTRGTASKLGWYNSTKTEAFCKTGTTNNSKDGWLCGATPYYSIAVWVGYDTPKTLSNLYGATYPGQIWKNSMLYMIDGLDTAKLEKDTSSNISDDEKDEEHNGGYYSYLEGRDDSEVLSDGYTVADYRSDRVIGEDVYAIIKKMKALDKNSSTFSSDLEGLYYEGQQYVDSIYSRNYTAEMQGKLDEAYESLKR